MRISDEVSFFNKGADGPTMVAWVPLKPLDMVDQLEAVVKEKTKKRKFAEV